MAVRCMSTAGPECPAWFAGPRCGPRCWRAGICSGAAGASAGAELSTGFGVVTLRPDGTIAGVLADPAAATSYLDGGGRVAVRIHAVHVWWPETTLTADVDEVEFSYRGRDDLGLVVRNSFTGGWSVRVTFLNHPLQPLRIAAELAWIPAATSPARALERARPGRTQSPDPTERGRCSVASWCSAPATRSVRTASVSAGSRSVRWNDRSGSGDGASSTSPSPSVTGSLLCRTTWYCPRARRR